MGKIISRFLLSLALSASSTCLFSQVVYVVNSVSSNVAAYTVNASSGALISVPGSPFAAGLEPTGVAVDPSGKFAYVANFLDGTVSAYTINASNGALTAVAGSPFPAGRTPTGVAVDGSGKFVYVTDNQLNNVLAYTINPGTGGLTAVQGSPFRAAGFPSGIVTDPSGKFVYVGNEGSGISAYTINAGSGALTAVPGSPLAAGTLPLGIAMHPTGKYVYVSSGNAIFSFSVNTNSGALTMAPGSPVVIQNPQGLAVDPKGKFLYVTKDFPDAVLVYSIASDSGALTMLSNLAPMELTPIGVAGDPTGKFVYVINRFSGSAAKTLPDSLNVSAYAVNSSSGALTPVPGSPFPALDPVAIAIRSQPIAPALPAITSIAPSSATAGGPAFTLTITGTAFLSGATTQWNGTALTTTYLSATQLTAAVPASLIATAGSSSVTVSNPGGMVSSAVKFTINPVSISISANGVVNAASHAGGTVSAGEIVNISGSNFGPGAFTGSQLDSNGYVTTTLGGVQALFDGVAAPLLSAQAGQVTAVVPYEVSGNPSTQLQISYQGQTSSAVTIPVAAAAPGIFTADSSGSGQGLITNEDGTANAPGNAASVGSTVVVYATGEGQTIPVGVDGEPGDPATPPVPVQTVTATVGGEDAPVVAAGGISGMTAGYLQVSVQIPPDVTVGDAVSIVLTIGGIGSQGNVTLAIQ